MGETVLEPSRRNSGLDLLKTIAIFLVVFVHDNSLNIDFYTQPSFFTYINYGFYSLVCLCVPILFFVNGALILNKPFDAKKLFRKTLKIIALCVGWGIVTLAVIMRIRGDSFSAVAFLKDLWYWKLDYINHLWFLQALAIIYFFLLVLIPMWQKRSDGYQLFFVSVLVFVVGNAVLLALANVFQAVTGVDEIQGRFNFFNMFNPFTGTFGYSLAYVLIGGWMFAYRERFYARKWKKIAAAALLADLLLLVGYGMLLSIKNGTRYVIGTVEYGSIFAFAGTICLFILLQDYQARGWLGRVVTLIGRNTLTIYLLHRMISIPIWQHIAGISDKLWFNFGITLLTVLLCAIIGEGLRRIPVVKAAVTL